MINFSGKNIQKRIFNKGSNNQQILIDIPKQTGSTTTTTGETTLWAVIKQGLVYNEAGGDTYTLNLITFDNPSTGGYTEGSEITIDRALGYEGYYNSGADTNDLDLRNYVPWYSVGSIVKVLERYDLLAEEEIYFIDLPIAYTGEETIASLRWDSDTGIVQAVWA